jgi:chitin disaccharide deacetylase
VSERVLIVNADDFGRSRGVNEGVIKCYRQGIVTSATLMVRWRDAAAAVASARAENLPLGLHIDLGEWEHLDGEWHPRYEVMPAPTPETVAAELAWQLDRFERLVGRAPTHLDSHQHAHREEPVRGIVLEVGARLGVPVRDASPGIAYSGAFYGQDGRGTPVPDAISVGALIATIEGLAPGITELGCHPATTVDHQSTYAHERLVETATLCDPRIRTAIDRSGIVLRSFADLRQCV